MKKNFKKMLAMSLACGAGTFRGRGLHAES